MQIGANSATDIPSPRNRLLYSFFEFLSDLFPPPQVQRESFQRTMIRLISTYLWWFLQMLLFLEQRDRKVGDSVVDGFWLVISCTRPDSLLSIVSASQMWFYTVCFGTIACWISLLMLYLERLLEVKPSKEIRNLLQIATRLMTASFMIPWATGIIAVLFQDERFGGGIDGTTETWGKPLSIPIYGMFLAYAALVELATFEFDMCQNTAFIKSEITQDLLSLLLTQLTALSYYIISPRSYPLHLAIVLIGASFVAWRHTKCLPYYLYAYNLMFIWSRGAVAASCIAFLVGYFSDSPICGFFLMLTLVISLLLAMLLSFESYQVQILSRKSKHLQDTTDPYDQELGLRQSFSIAFFSEDKSQRISYGQIAIDHLNWLLLVSRKVDIARILILKFFVILHALGNERGARMCLSQASEVSESLIEMFMIAKCEIRLKGSNSLEEILFLRYLEEMKVVKMKDEYVCIQLTAIWTELASVHPNISRVNSLSLKIEREIRSLKHHFSKIVKTFPGSFELYDLFASLQEEVLSANDKAKPWRVKATGYQKEYTRNGRKDDVASIDFFDSSTGVIIADLRPSNFCEITYMSKLACSILDYDQKSVQISKLTNVIPLPYRDLHLKALEEFLKDAATLEINHPSQMPFVTSKGFLVFCVSKIIFSSSNGNPVLAIAFKPLRSLQEGAILSEDLTIEMHSEFLPRFIGSRLIDMKGKRLQDIRPSIIRMKSPSGMSPCFQIFKNQPFCGMFMMSQFGQTRVYFFFAFKSDQECMKWNMAVNDSKSSLYISSLAESDRRGSVFFPTAAELLPEADKYDLSLLKIVEEPVKSKHPGSSHKGSTSSDSSGRKRELFKYKAMLKDGFKGCTLIAAMTVVLLVALNVSAAVVIKSQVDAITSTNMIDKVAAKQIFSGQLAFSARMLSTDSVPKSLISMFERNLQYFVITLEDVQNHIWDEIDQSQSVEYEQFSIEKNVMTWELIDGEIEFVRRTLIDAVQKLIDEVRTNQSWSIVHAYNGTIPLSSAFYLCRNGLGETYQALNKAKQLFLRSSKANIEAAIQLYYVYLLIAFGVISICTLASLPIMRKLHKVSTGISKVLLCNPIHAYYEEKQRLLERLQLRYDLELDLSIEHPFRGERDAFNMYHPGTTLLISISLLWIAVVSFYCPLYFNVFSELATRLQANPAVLSYDSTRLVNMIEADIWMSEEFLADIGSPTAALIPSFSLNPEPRGKMISILKGVAEASNLLFLEVLNGFEITPDHFSFLYSATNFSAPYFHSGYRTGAKMLMSEIMYCLNTDSAECALIINQLYTTVVELATNTYAISEYYKADCREIVKKNVDKIHVLMLSCSAALVLGIGMFIGWVNFKLFRVGKALLKIGSTMAVPKWRDKTMKDSTIDGN